MSLLRCTIGVALALGLAACGYGSTGAASSSPSSSPSSSSSSSPSSSSSTSPSSSSSSSSQAPTAAGTEQVILKPVDAQGIVVSGFTTDDKYRNQRPIDCSFGDPSVHDVAQGVRDCGGTSDSGDACWARANGAEVLCLLDPFKNVLFVRTATGTDTPLKPTAHAPVPIGLVLDDGTQCRYRIGGAGSRQELHPDWAEAYYCADEGAVWSAPPYTESGIDRGSDVWTVQVGGASGPLTTRKVTKALLVGMA